MRGIREWIFTSKSWVIFDSGVCVFEGAGDWRYRGNDRGIEYHGKERVVYVVRSYVEIGMGLSSVHSGVIGKGFLWE